MSNPKNATGWRSRSEPVHGLRLGKLPSWLENLACGVRSRPLKAGNKPYLITCATHAPLSWGLELSLRFAQIAATNSIAANPNVTTSRQVEFILRLLPFVAHLRLINPPGRGAFQHHDFDRTTSTARMYGFIVWVGPTAYRPEGMRRIDLCQIKKIRGRQA